MVAAVRRLLLPLLLSTALVAFACGGDDDQSDEPTRPPGDTGIPAVDEVLARIRARDLASLRSAVRLTALPCTTTTGGGAGGPPRCLDGEADGQVVQVFPHPDGCQGDYARDAKVSELLRDFLIDTPVQPFAVLTITGNSKLGYVTGDRYGLVLDAGSKPALLVALSDDGKITRLYTGCTATAQELLGRASSSGDVIHKFE